MNFVKVIAALAAVAVVLIFFGQRSMIFPAPIVRMPAEFPDFVEFIELNEGYGLLLSPTTETQAPAPLLIYFHGNGAAAFWRIDRVKVMRNAGFYVLLLEYPGYADAPGSPSLQSIQRSAIEAYDKITARDTINASKVIAYGRSIGGGAATALAAKRDVAALGLESSFTSLSTLVAEKHWPAFLLRDRFDNLSVVENLRVPVFLYHGSADTMIPIHHTEQLSRVAEKYEFFQAACGHSDCPPGWDLLLEFLSNQGVM